MSQKTNNHNSINVRYNKKENILIILEKDSQIYNNINNERMMT